MVVLAVQHGQGDYVCVFTCECTGQHTPVFGHSCIEFAVDPARLVHLSCLCLNSGLWEGKWGSFPSMMYVSQVDSAR